MPTAIFSLASVWGTDYTPPTAGRRIEKIRPLWAVRCPPSGALRPQKLPVPLELLRDGKQRAREAPAEAAKDVADLAALADIA
jgi:hypothetical protein